MSHEWYRMLLEEMKNVLNHPVFLAFYEYLENEVQFRYLKKGSLISNVVKVEEANAYLEQLNRDSSVFEHIAPEKSISGFSRSYGTIPFHVKGEKTGLYFEYSDYRVTSQREIELYFFIAKTLSERGDEY
jgi:hypothetical protein